MSRKGETIVPTHLEQHTAAFSVGDLIHVPEDQEYPDRTDVILRLYDNTFTTTQVFSTSNGELYAIWSNLGGVNPESVSQKNATMTKAEIIAAFSRGWELGFWGEGDTKAREHMAELLEKELFLERKTYTWSKSPTTV